MRFRYLLILSFLAACSESEQPYVVVSNDKLAKNSYGISLKGDEGISLSALHGFMWKEARNTCGGPFLVRDHKVTSNKTIGSDDTQVQPGQYYILHVEFDCFKG